MADLTLRLPWPNRCVRDGLYRVSTSYLCAGFLVEQGRVSRCAPILRKRLDFWKRIAVWIGP